MSDRKAAKKEEENLWNSVLSEALKSTKFTNHNILILGDKNSGKRTLLNALQEISETEIPSKKNESNKLGMKGLASLMEYTYLDVKNLNDRDNDTMAKLSVYLIDDAKQKEILDSILTEEFVRSLIIVLMVDFSEPWRFLQSLNEWLDLVTGKISQMKIALKTQDEMRAKILEHILNFKEPVFEEDGKLVKKVTIQKDEPQESNLDALRKQAAELKEGVLKVNYGIPIIIVVNKSDLVENIEREKDGEKKMDFVNYSLRSLAITYGATLIYVSCRSNVNLDVLYEYMLHRIYNFDLRFKPELVHKESFFIPSGFDNQNLINTFYQNLDKTLLYEEFIKEPQIKKGPVKEDVIFEDYQTFLSKLKEKLASSADLNKPTVTLNQLPSLGHTSTGGLEKPLEQKTLEPTPQAGGNPPNTQNSEALRNFYSNLMNPSAVANRTPSNNKFSPAFDPKQLKEKAERDIMEKINKLNINMSVPGKDSKPVGKTIDKDQEKILDLLKKGKK